MPLGNRLKPARRRGGLSLLLAVSVGLPYFMLSTTGPLVQAWFSRTFPGRSPYRLYALSNIGSLLALLSYPFYVESTWPVGHQANYWSWGFIAFAVLCGITAAMACFSKQTAPVELATAENFAAQIAPPPTAGRKLAWLTLPALASFMLLATTNHVCQDVAAVPLLWVMPLGLYLTTFIICFDHERWYARQWVAGAAVVVLCLATGIDQLITAGAKVSLSFIVELASVFRGDVPTVHGLPRRVGAAQAIDETSHDVLLDDLRRRRAWGACS